MPKRPIPQPKKKQILQNNDVLKKTLRRPLNSKTTRLTLKNILIILNHNNPNLQKIILTQRLYHILPEMDPILTTIIIKHFLTNLTTKKHNTKRLK